MRSHELDSVDPHGSSTAKVIFLANLADSVRLMGGYERETSERWLIKMCEAVRSEPGTRSGGRAASHIGDRMLGAFPGAPPRRPTEPRRSIAASPSVSSSPNPSHGVVGLAVPAEITRALSHIGGAMKNSMKYSPEIRKRAVRVVFEARREHESQRMAAVWIAGKIGCTAQTLHS